MSLKSPAREPFSSRQDVSAQFQPAVPGTHRQAPGSWYVSLHVALIPSVLALLAAFASSTGFDQSVSDRFYNAAQARFPAHDSFWLELLGHRIAKDAIWLVAIGLLASAIGVGRLRATPEERRAIWIALIAMAIGPGIVYLLKQTTGHHCPWDLRTYGGFAEYNFDWFVTAANAGHCFPSGHSSAGYSLIALYFLGHAVDRPGLARSGLIAAIVVGAAFSVVRVAQGAHFLSHSLLAAAIDWSAAALVFTPLLLRKPR